MPCTVFPLYLFRCSGQSRLDEHIPQRAHEHVTGTRERRRLFRRVIGTGHLERSQLTHEVHDLDMHNPGCEHRTCPIVTGADYRIERARRAPYVEAAVVFDLLEPIEEIGFAVSADKG